MKTDRELELDVADQLDFEPCVNAHNIAVSARNGVVTLQGSVPSYADKVAATNSAKLVNGVKGLHDEVVVALPGIHQRADKQIAMAALNAIKSITTVPPDSLRVIVRNGRLMLDGNVENRCQKEIVEEIVKNITGVVSVTNLLSLKPQEPQPDVETAIKSAFERHALLHAEKIQVEALGSRIILRGSASSLVEKDEAERAAWSARGVTEVENCITVAD